MRPYVTPKKYYNSNNNNTNNNSKNNNTNYNGNNNNKQNLEHTSLCIPRVEISVTLEYITSVIKKWNIGIISRIKEIPLRKEQNYKRIIIDLYWNVHNVNVKNVKDIMDKKGSMKLVYDMPWYWKLVYTTEQSGWVPSHGGGGSGGGFGGGSDIITHSLVL